jgi:hypothetical protein
MKHPIRVFVAVHIGAVAAIGALAMAVGSITANDERSDAADEPVKPAGLTAAPPSEDSEASREKSS